MNPWTVRSMCLFSGSRRSKLPCSSVLILVWLLGRVSCADVNVNVFLTFGCPELSKEITVGYLKVIVALFVPNPIRCFN